MNTESVKAKYVALVCGGIGDEIWEKELECVAGSIVEAALTFQKLLDDDLSGRGGEIIGIGKP